MHLPSSVLENSSNLPRRPSLPHLLGHSPPTKLKQPRLREQKSTLSTAVNSTSLLIPSKSSPFFLLFPPVQVELTQKTEFCEEFEKAGRAKKAGKVEEAREIYEEMRKIWPESEEIRVNLGVCMMELGKFEEALGIFDENEAQSHKLALIFNKSLCCFALKDTNEAIRLLKLAESLPNPSNFPIKSAKFHILSQISPSQPRYLTESIDESPFESQPETSYSQNTPIPVTKSQEYLKNRKKSMWNLFKSIDDFGEREGIRRFTPVRVRVRRKSQGTAKGKSLSPIPHRPSRTVLRKKKSTEPYPPEDDYISTEITAVSDFQPKITRSPARKTRRCGDLMQEDLEDETKLRQVQFDTEEDLIIKEKFRDLRKIMQNEGEKLTCEELIPEGGGEKTGFGRLSRQELVLFRSLIQRENRENAENEAILRIVSQLKFFARFQWEVRSSVLEVCRYRYCQSGERVFGQGEPGSLMYILIHGSVLLQKSSPEYGHTNLTVGTLYDGDSFGEMSLFHTQGERGNTPRAVTCVTAEACDLLEVQKETFHRIIMQQVESAIEAKLKFLMGIGLFTGVESVNLVPLATNIELVRYQLDQVIVRKGAVPPGMFIIVSGIVKIYTSGFPLKDAKKDEFASARMKRSPSVQPFRLGQVDYRTVKKPAWTLHPEKQGTRSSSARNLHSCKQENMLLAVLQTGDYFGGRCLLAGNKQEQGEVEASTCSAVAESAEVTVYILTPTHLQYLGEKLSVSPTQDTVISRLAKKTDPDCPSFINKREFKEECLQWKRYKRDLVDLAYRGWFVDRHKQRIISALREGS